MTEKGTSLAAGAVIDQLYHSIRTDQMQEIGAREHARDLQPINLDGACRRSRASADEHQQKEHSKREVPPLCVVVTVEPGRRHDRVC